MFGTLYALHGRVGLGKWARCPLLRCSLFIYVGLRSSNFEPAYTYGPEERDEQSVQKLINSHG
jgi:hypothetical protein